jgi:hypothetical protein
MLHLICGRRLRKALLFLITEFTSLLMVSSALATFTDVQTQATKGSASIYIAGSSDSRSTGVASELSPYSGVAGRETYEGDYSSLYHTPKQSGTIITVNSTTDSVEGNVSSVPTLLANPGPGGITLREAILATDQVTLAYTSVTDSIDKIEQSILSKAFRGELVPQDPNDEPAQQLLARLKVSPAA